MSTLLPTLTIAFIFVLIALALMGISWLITGKLRMRPGACGRDPTKKRDEKSCGASADCQLCEKPEKRTKE